MTDIHNGFAELGLLDPLVQSLSEAGITSPFPIQETTLPVALKGADVIGQAKTGTGKTFGFALPLLQRFLLAHEAETAPSAPGAPHGLVVVPTRELALQVAGDLTTASRHTDIQILTLYGGKNVDDHLAQLRRRVDVIVGTPGRLLDMYSRGALILHNVRTAVLDEADEMLNLGFLPDVQKIIAALPSERQTMLFSATMPAPILSLARQFMEQPTHIRADDEPGDTTLTTRTTRQFIYRAHAMDKMEVIARVLQSRDSERTIIFTRTKRTADRTSEDLKDRGFAAQPLHGDLDQDKREKVLRGFREGRYSILVATDVAARGIDIADISHVINYQCPEDAHTYVHRIGRTGRAGHSGVAVTLVDWDDIPRWGLIARTLELDTAEPVETYSTSEHLYSDLNIPQDVTGSITRASGSRGGGVTPRSRRTTSTSSSRRTTSAAPRRRRTRRGKPTE